MSGDYHIPSHWFVNAVRATARDVFNRNRDRLIAEYMDRLREDLQTYIEVLGREKGIYTKTEPLTEAASAGSMRLEVYRKITRDEYEKVKSDIQYEDFTGEETLTARLADFHFHKSGRLKWWYRSVTGEVNGEIQIGPGRASFELPEISELHDAIIQKLGFYLRPIRQEGKNVSIAAANIRFDNLK